MTPARPARRAPAPPNVWRVELPGLLPLPNATLAMPLRERMATKRRWREWAELAVRAAGVPRLGRARVAFVRHSAGTPDDDALPAACKPCLDGIVRSGVLDDDGPLCVRLSYAAARCKRGGARVEIEIRPWE